MGHTLRRATLWAASPGLAAIVVFGTLSFDSPQPQHIPHEEGPPPAHTGGFNEPNCTACHAEFELNPSSGALGIDGFPTVYQPGQQYSVSVSVLGDEMVYSGFQAAIRFGHGPKAGKTAGLTVPVDTNVGVRRSDDGVDYVQHTRAGSRVVANGVATWTFVWNAPDDTTSVVIHVAANDANGDNSPLGDFVYTNELVSNGTSGDIRGPQPVR